MSTTVAAFSPDHQRPGWLDHAPTGYARVRVPDGLLTTLIALLIVGVVLAIIGLTLVRLARAVERTTRRLFGTRKVSRRAAKRRPASRNASPRPPARPTPSPRSPQHPPTAPGPIVRIRSAFQPRPEMAWHGPTTPLQVHNLVIPAPMVYVAVGRRPTGVPLDPSEIIPSLLIDRRMPASPAREWSTYDQFDPAQRWAYLSWLAAGRVGPPDDPAFLLLFLQGLERRALGDQADLGPVVHELCRLRDLVSRAQPADASTADKPRHTAFMRQSGSILWTLVALRPDAFTERDIRVLASRTQTWSEEALVSALAWAARRGTALPPAVPPVAPPTSPAIPAPPTMPTLPPWLAQIAAGQQPGARRSVVIERLPDKFAALFESRLSERHPAGLPLRVSKREREVSYRPANRALQAVTCRVPDTLAISSQFTPLVDLWNSCIDDLRGLSRLGASPGNLTLAQWEALPPDLRAGMDNPFADALADLAATHADADGHAIVSVEQVCTACRLDLPDRPSLTPTLSRRLAAAVADAGMALEPDARLSATTYTRQSPVVLLPTAIALDPNESATPRYLAASCVLRLGAAVALADGNADQNELAPIAQELERAFDLSEDDHRRLDALLVLLRARGSDLRAVGKRLLDTLSIEARRSVGRLLIAVASGDGIITDAERTTLRACYRALGLAAADLDSALSVLAAPGSAQAADVGANATTPPPLQLNRDAVRAIMAETREVAQLLADAMRGDDATPAQTPSPATFGQHAPAPDQSVELIPDIDRHETPTPAPSAIPAAHTEASGPAAASPRVGPRPPTRYADFFNALIARDAWPISEAQALARAHRHMLSGAVEALNDWAFEHAGGPLVIEEAEHLAIDPDRLRLLGERADP